MITVGQITKPQGVRGEVKVRPMTNDPSRFYVLKAVYIDNVAYKLSAVRVSGGDVYLKLAGIADRNAAETLRNKLLQIDRAAAVALDDGEFFIDDVVGATLVSKSADGCQSIGTVKSVQSFGAADVFTVATERGEMTFAFIKALNAEYDEDKRELTVDGDRLREVAVYED